MGSSRAKEQRATRRAKLEEMRRAEAARERRNRIITWTCSALVVVGVVGASWYFIDRTNKRDEAEAAAAAKPVAGEKSFKDLGRNHVTTPVDYKMSPAVGGDHNQAWMNCNGDVYDKEIGETNAVHSLEHGAVWVTYNDKAGDKDVKTLKDRVAKTPYTLMSPYADQSSPIMLSAWGKQLSVDSADDPRVGKFLDKYVQGVQTPEPGAACTGGTSA
ncbi:DUF3105 domain-containing protein [Streptomyces coelicoflavus]|uniref:DUF3105 domain-containing protein n=2 Tax=Streptomyces TaxID=1883 RepID=A0A369UVD9_9ACTN|nr:MULTISPECIES: DUF3105 domain-containing protein [Streptomyces]MYS46647.1 DUF3105 domain-containing protein [Streptomyces sp. SID5998]WDI21490.1 DUF3105 domain-containing protein [Streptomyces enissocaesilis]AIV33355.1 membrane protein [Streptomyces sp. CCM_MD2014]MCT7350639.1 DUF3105 domain-containing protein [Streptomyces sp. 15-116A]MCW1097613.1 DUF3105 domain-containing protein [Streptomyces sp. RS2]